MKQNPAAALGGPCLAAASGVDLPPQASGRGNRRLRPLGIHADAHRAGAYPAWITESSAQAYGAAALESRRSLRPGFRLSLSRPSHSTADRHPTRRTRVLTSYGT